MRRENFLRDANGAVLAHPLLALPVLVEELALAAVAADGDVLAAGVAFDLFDDTGLRVAGGVTGSGGTIDGSLLTGGHYYLAVHATAADATGLYEILATQG